MALRASELGVGDTYELVVVDTSTGRRSCSTRLVG